MRVRQGLARSTAAAMAMTCVSWLVPAAPAGASHGSNVWDVTLNHWQGNFFDNGGPGGSARYYRNMRFAARMHAGITTGSFHACYRFTSYNGVEDDRQQQLTYDAPSGLWKGEDINSGSVGSNVVLQGVINGGSCPGSRVVLFNGTTTPPASNTTTVDDGQAPTPLPDGQQPLPSVPTTAPSCSRVLSQNNGANVANFKSGEAPDGWTSTYSWNFGDGTAAGTTSDPQHIYGALSTQPQGGWTAVLTVTRTGNGTTYAVGPVTAQTCSLRVDFLNPTQSTPSSTTQDEPDDADCPTGWGWLNPTAIAKVLRCLFIPTETTTEVAGDTYDSWQGSVLGIATVPIEVLVDGWTAFADGVDNAYDGYGCEGPTVNVPLGDDGIELTPLRACGDGGVTDTLATLVRIILRFLFYIGGALAVMRVFGAGIGWRPGVGAQAED